MVKKKDRKKEHHWIFSVFIGHERFNVNRCSLILHHTASQNPFGWSTECPKGSKPDDAQLMAAIEPFQICYSWPFYSTQRLSTQLNSFTVIHQNSSVHCLPNIVLSPLCFDQQDPYTFFSKASTLLSCSNIIFTFSAFLSVFLSLYFFFFLRRKEFCELCLAKDRQTDKVFVCKKFLKKDGRKVRKAAKNEIMILKLYAVGLWTDGCMTEGWREAERGRMRECFVIRNFCSCFQSHNPCNNRD